MRVFAPRYFLDFKCIMGACRHSCCVGWEMPVDGPSIERYESLGGADREWVKSRIEGDATPHFCVSEGKRCAFLRGDGLCEMIIRLGEDSLCEVCREHPRYYNVLSDRCEAGLGLCCEEAARLALFDGDDTFMELGDDGEATVESEDFEVEMLELRSCALEIIDGEGELLDKLKTLEDAFGVPENARSVQRMHATLLGLERLEDGFGDIIAAMPLDNEIKSGYDGALLRLLRYFVYRHTTTAESEFDFGVRLGFCLLSVRVVDAICRGKDKGGVIEAVRQYCAEVEYSEDNMQAMLGDIAW